MKRPQAAGSSLLARITHCLVRSALHEAGLRDVDAVQVFPVATGMALTLAYLACAATKPFGTAR
jgi:O-phospho-L-seryl-tRNASec:L-selenocysteinyl-tRNA synthase